MTFFCVVFLGLSGKCQSYFYKNYGGNEFNVARGILINNNGYIYLLGSTDNGATGSNYDATVTKLLPDGTLIRHYFFDENNTYEEGRALCAVKNSNNMLLVYQTEHPDSGTNIVVAEIDENANPIWKKHYGTTGNDLPAYVSPCYDGGYIIAGFTNDSNGYGDLLALKLDATGNQQWLKQYGGNQNDYACSVHQLPDSGYIVCGDTYSYGEGRYDHILYRLKGNGDALWQKTYGDSLSNGSQGVLIMPGNRMLLYGETEVNAAGPPFDINLFYLDYNGTIIWNKKMPEPGTDAAFSCMQNDSLQLVLTGYSNSKDITKPLDIVLLNMDTLGNKNWIRQYGDAGVDIGYGVIYDTARTGYYIVGKTVISGNDNMALLHTNLQGEITEIIHLNPNVSLLKPNPSNGTVCLETGSVKDCISVYSANGEWVKSIDLSPSSPCFNLDINKGIYFVKMELKSGIRWQKLVISN